MAVRAIVLAAVVLVAFGMAAPIAIRLGGPIALVAATMAAVLCLASAILALVIVDRLRTPSSALAALWISMTIRSGVPLAIGITIHLHGGPLAQAGLLWYLIGFYAIVLTVGTILSLPPTTRPATPAR